MRRDGATPSLGAVWLHETVLRARLICSYLDGDSATADPVSMRPVSLQSANRLVESIINLVRFGYSPLVSAKCVFGMMLGKFRMLSAEDPLTTSEDAVVVVLEDLLTIYEQ